ncbi:MAG TPA: DUF3883 domain-containing protein [Puia sp.]|nr:DUF3883 domain-containing protein [Puia sp.]
MKLSPIEKEHILMAADTLDQTDEQFWAEYWLYIPEKVKSYPFKEIVKRAYTIATGIEISPDFFQSNEAYRSYIEKTFAFPITFRIRDNQDFFSEADFNYFHQFAGKLYDPGNEDNKRAGKLLSSMFYSKVNTWARALDLEGFSVDFKYNWQIMGHFSSYAWARIFRKENVDIPVYFTIEANGDEECLKFKLDYQFRGENRLTPAQEHIFKRIVSGTDAAPRYIYSGELSEHNWETLIAESKEFIEHYIPLYDEVVFAIKKPATSTMHLPGDLKLQPVPAGLIDKPVMQQRKYTTNADYDQENKEKKKTGTGGEDLVIALERRALSAQNRTDLAALVDRVPDWHGYDIRSYFADGRPKYIEVKTTTGTENRPFFWTWNEREQMKRYPGTYFLYRLYNYDNDTSTADYFILDGNISDKIHEIPIQYTVYIKQIRSS